MFLSAEFRAREQVVQAVRDLTAQGFVRDRLDLYSDEPVEMPAGVLPRRSYMSLGAVTGAVLLLLLTIGFVYFTQYNYPLVTGAMPIFSFWATGVIFYELTMLGAILTTFCWFLWESGVLRRKRRGPVPELKDGAILLRVECEGNQGETANRVLREAGAESVQELRA
ncbi:MAG TPA: quinol:electron acceptor oxidoreductase subunit ActD [Bryobacteraceae bacterium]|nr:quinol:electron acceptor oxidoreductase subunit ActD [Bryobacteraceae bacterium]